MYILWSTYPLGMNDLRKNANEINVYPAATWLLLAHLPSTTSGGLISKRLLRKTARWRAMEQTKKNKKQKLRRSFVLTPTQIEIDQ